MLSFSHDQSGSGTAAFSLESDAWTRANNGSYFVAIQGQDVSGQLSPSQLTAYLGRCGIAEVRLLLQGPYLAATGTMSTALRAAGSLPLHQPYNTPPWNYSGTEQVSSLPDSIVDWVLLELRDKQDNTHSIERRAGLLTQNGLVLNTGLTTGLYFTAAENPSDYYIVAWHRNHMPVMSGLPVSLPNSGQPYDFTRPGLNPPYKHNDPLPAELELDGSGRYGLIAGDINADRVLSYLGDTNDRALILSRILGVSGQNNLNRIISGYYAEDLNLDNNVIYLGDSNDRGLILSNLLRLTGSNNLTSVYYSVVP